MFHSYQGRLEVNMADLELESMAKMNDLLEVLTEEQRRRVILWALDKFKVSIGSTTRPLGLKDSSTAINRELTSNPQGLPEFSDLAGLFEACSPNSDREKALVAGYWLQLSSNGKEWDTENANEQLKELGQGINNVALAVHGLKPKFILQTKTQADDGKKRKQYRLTTLGIKKVRDMISGASAGEEQST
jgi:hypothetical protein